MKTRELVAWLALAALAVTAIAVLLPRAFPLLPRGWETDAAEAEAIALARLAELGPLPEGPIVVVRWEGSGMLEHHLLRRGLRGLDTPTGRELREGLFAWDVRLYDPSSSAGEWSVRARVSPQGEVLDLRRQLPREAAAGEIDETAARGRAEEVLREAGFDLAAFGPPEARRDQLARRTDLRLRYAHREQLAGPRVRHGVEVVFLGDQYGGFHRWTEEEGGGESVTVGSPDEPAGRGGFAGLLSSYVLVYFGVSILLFLTLLVLGVLFARKYHAGEVGVRRGGQIFLLCLLAAIGYLTLYALPLSESFQVGTISRRLVVGVALLVRVVFGFLPIAVAGALAWLVGESWARERWGSKLAAFDALFKRQWATATVARSSLRGLVLGLVLVAALLAACLPLQRFGVWPFSSLLVELQFGSAGWLGIGHVLRFLAYELPVLLVTCLFLPTLVARKLGGVGGALLSAVMAMAVALPPFMPLPVSGGVPVWLLGVAAPVLVFWAFDLLAALLTAWTALAVVYSLPLLLAADRGMQLQGCIPLAAAALPLLLSLRQLQGGGQDIVYRWEDVPPHVRRIAERERQRVELETAREIQGSILPELPPQLAGVALAHAYLPATEVGGDFYDVLALDDGRLVVAVGDVAGHGVSSGLVMSMVKSALAVQVTFDPRVEAVFATLNRMVYQNARRRLLATLSYVLLDPAREEVVYGSAGHIFPYRITAEGRVFELEAGSYPLGVRADLVPRVHRERLAAGDTVVLLSDGIVEARRQDGDEAFGFPRVAASLGRHAGGSPEALVRGVLADLETFTGGAPREDDVTVVAARLPG